MTEEINDLKNELNTLKEELARSNDKIDHLQHDLEQSEIALAKLSKMIEKTRFDTEEKLLKRISSEILPILNEIMNEKISDKVRAKLDLVKTRLKIFIPSPNNPESILILLTPMEAQIASMVKVGYKSKDISNILNVTLDTVKSHRRKIRKKLNLDNNQIDLSLYLQHILE